MMQVFPPSDAKIFPEYILPLLSMLPDDPEESVRIAYAANIQKIAETSYRFMVRSQDMNEIVMESPSKAQNKGTVVEKRPSSSKAGVISSISLIQTLNLLLVISIAGISSFGPVVHPCYVK